LFLRHQPWKLQTMTKPPRTQRALVAGSSASSGTIEGAPTSARSGLSHHQALASASRMAVLELLRSRAQPLGVAEIARHVGLHQNTVRAHLDLLVHSGYAMRRSEAPSGPGRPPVVYEATAAPEGEDSYRLLAEVLVQHLVANCERPGEAGVQAGRRWARSEGRRQHAQQGAEAAITAPVSEDETITAVVRMLGDMGFAPELSADGTAIYMHRCPFRTLAESHPDVVCGAHLGMIQGALAEYGAPVSATRLLPLVEADLCITNLARPARDHDRVRHVIPI
jgi:predicted ArsR family transcriptional regulator